MAAVALSVSGSLGFRRLRSGAKNKIETSVSFCLWIDVGETELRSYGTERLLLCDVPRATRTPAICESAVSVLPC